MRIATYNVRHCRGLDGKVDVSRAADVIASLDADVVALQELDRFRARSGGEDQPSALARATGYQVRFFATLRDDGGEYGIAVAGRSSVPCSFERLPQHGAEEPRGVIVCALGEVTLLATHTATKPPARDAHLDALVGMCKTAGGPVVVAGDLNASKRFLGPLLRAGLDAGPRAGPTLAGTRRQIDWVLAAGGLRVAAARAVRSDASDHRPVVVEIEGV